MHTGKSASIIMVAAVIIKSGINRLITNTAGPGVIISSAITIVRYMESGINTIVGIAGQCTGTVTPDTAMEDSATRWCEKSTTIMAAQKVMLGLMTSSAHRPRYRIQGFHSPSG